MHELWPSELQNDLIDEITRLDVAIDREATAAAKLLRRHPPTLANGNLGSGPADHRELSRQLTALHEKVAQAQGRDEGRVTLRAELATLLAFARTLRADAESLPAAFEARRRELERRERAARREQQRLAAERDAWLRQRNALQSRIDAAAARMARESGGEWRRTLPCFRVCEAFTVCSALVVRPGIGLRGEQRWLISLDDAREELVVRRSYC
jgi:hypothetical protein